MPDRRSFIVPAAKETTIRHNVIAMRSLGSYTAERSKELAVKDDSIWHSRHFVGFKSLLRNQIKCESAP
jgi:hypothetical protein